jgi:hypothetical protein
MTTTSPHDPLNPHRHTLNTIANTLTTRERPLDLERWAIAQLGLFLLDFVEAEDVADQLVAAGVVVEQADFVVTNLAGLPEQQTLVDVALLIIEDGDAWTEEAGELAEELAGWLAEHADVATA